MDAFQGGCTEVHYQPMLGMSQVCVAIKTFNNNTATSKVLLCIWRLRSQLHCSEGAHHVQDWIC